MSLRDQGLTRRLKPLPARKSVTLSVLDVGTSKVVCLVAQLQPLRDGETAPGRTHVARVIGIGHQRSLGLKGGVVVDLDAVEGSVRQAIHSAERMAKVEIQSVIVNTTGGRIGSHHFEAGVAVRGGTVAAIDVGRVLESAGAHTLRPGRAVLHAMPTGFSLDGAQDVVEPVGMVGDRLGVGLHVVTGEVAASRNLMLAVERGHLGVEALVATPYASGLATLVDDEAEMGCVVIDMGGGTTSWAVFSGGRIDHVDAIAVGGHHVTMDIARGLTTRVSVAERLKTLYGAVSYTSSDEREMLPVPQADDGVRDTAAQVPRAQLVRIIRPRVEEILELVRDRLAKSGFAAPALSRVILTGGASQLAGLPWLAERVLHGQVRIAGPVGVRGLPEAAKGPAFAAAVGLLVYPQVAHLGHVEPRPSGLFGGVGSGGYFSRMGSWFRESF